MKNTTIIILSILLGIFSWYGINGFQTDPTSFEIFSALVFACNALLLFFYLISEIRD